MNLIASSHVVVKDMKKRTMIFHIFSLLGSRLCFMKWGVLQIQKKNSGTGCKKNDKLLLNSTFYPFDCLITAHYLLPILKTSQSRRKQGWGRDRRRVLEEKKGFWLTWWASPRTVENVCTFFARTVNPVSLVTASSCKSESQEDVHPFSSFIIILSQCSVSMD